MFDPVSLFGSALAAFGGGAPPMVAPRPFAPPQRREERKRPADAPSKPAEPEAAPKPEAASAPPVPTMPAPTSGRTWLMVGGAAVGGFVLGLVVRGAR